MANPKGVHEDWYHAFLKGDLNQNKWRLFESVFDRNILLSIPQF